MHRPKTVAAILAFGSLLLLLTCPLARAGWGRGHRRQGPCPAPCAQNQAAVQYYLVEICTGGHWQTVARVTRLWDAVQTWEWYVCRGYFCRIRADFGADSCVPPGAPPSLE